MEQIRTVIGGCRDYCNYEEFCVFVDRCLNELSGEVVILSGHCSGVDEMAERYAKQHGIKCEVYSADWKRYGRAAGPIRNRHMVEQCSVVIAFRDGKSRGTKSLISLAEAAQKRLYVQMIV